MTGISRESSPRQSTDGGQDGRYEEILAMRDDDGPSTLVSVTSLLFLALVVSTVGASAFLIVTTVGDAATAVGGMDALEEIVHGMFATRPVPFVGVLAILLIAVAWFLLTVVGMARSMRGTFDEQIHVQVTDTGLVVERDGSRLGQSPGVEIPIDAITTVEYLDPEESSMRGDLGDLRAEKFLAGRSRNWVRVDRTGDRAVYVGSDSPRELAETIVQRAPGVEVAEPY